jgi:hypothetical protein
MFLIAKSRRVEGARRTDNFSSSLPDGTAKAQQVAVGDCKRMCWIRRTNLSELAEVRWP